MSERVVLCGANAYEKKYYFNRLFEKLPDAIKDELHIICVLFTEEAGGVFTMVFEEDGTLSLETEAAEEDILYDEIGSALLVKEVQRRRQELFESLTLFYKVVVEKNHLMRVNCETVKDRKYGIGKLLYTGTYGRRNGPAISSVMQGEGCGSCVHGNGKCESDYAPEP